MKEIMINKNGVTLFADDKFNLHYGAEVYLWQGNLNYENKRLTRELLLHDSLNTQLRINGISGVGVILIINLQDESVSCYSSVHNTEYVFFFRQGKNIYFLMGMPKVISVVRKPCCNINVIKKTLLSNQLFHDEVILNNIGFLKPGYYLLIDMYLNVKENYFLIKERGKETNIIESISENILLSLDHRESGLFYSGGFDSSLLLYIMKESGISFKAYHKEFFGQGNDSEYYIAAKKARLCGIELIKIDECLDYSLDSYNDQYYDFPHQIPICLSYDTSGVITRGMNSSPIQFISGHGGDAVFGQNTSGLACIDAFIDNGIISAYIKAKELAKLKGITFFNIIDNCIKQKRVSLSDKYPGKSEHIKNIIESIYLIHPSRRSGSIDIISPILFENVILEFLSMPSYEHFDSHLDRKLIREIAANKYDDLSLLKTNKKSSSNILFNVLNSKQIHIYDLVVKKNLLQVINMTPQEFKDILYLQSNVRYIASDFILIYKLYQMAIFLNLYDLNI